MFLFLGAINIIIAFLFFIYFAVSSLNDMLAVAILLTIIQLVVNSIVFYKFHRIEKNTKWFKSIAEKHGYREPTGAEQLPWLDESKTNPNNNERR